MRHIMAGFWWILFLRGLLGILLGLEALWLISVVEWQSDGLLGLSSILRPEEAWATLVFLLSLYAILDGLFAVTLGAQDFGGGRRWWTLVAEGTLSLALGFLVWLSPNATFLAVLYWIAVWAILTGFLEMGQGLRGTEYRDRRGPLFYAGLCSVIFGLAVLCPGISGMGLVWLIGAYAFLFGIPLLVMGIHLRKYFLKYHRHGLRLRIV